MPNQMMRQKLKQNQMLKAEQDVEQVTEPEAEAIRNACVNRTLTGVVGGSQWVPLVQIAPEGTSQTMGSVPQAEFGEI